LGLVFPLTSRQILTVNLITDVLPALAVALQEPEHHHLAALAHEGAAAFDTRLRKDIGRRALATVAPTLASYLVTLRSSSMPQARTVAFASIIATQLAQTLDVGWGEGGLSHAVLGVVAGSAGVFIATLAVPLLRSFLGLALPDAAWLGSDRSRGAAGRLAWSRTRRCASGRSGYRMVSHRARWRPRVMSQEQRGVPIACPMAEEYGHTQKPSVLSA
jgi:magnesium-transporting ATPase (P-type)